MNGQCNECKKEDVKLIPMKIHLRGRPMRRAMICERCAGDYEDYVDKEINRIRDED